MAFARARTDDDVDDDESRRKKFEADRGRPAGRQVKAPVSKEPVAAGSPFMHPALIKTPAGAWRLPRGAAAAAVKSDVRFRVWMARARANNNTRRGLIVLP